MINFDNIDDSVDLKRRYTQEQLLKIWDDTYPKLSEISSDKIIITITPPERCL